MNHRHAQSRNRAFVLAGLGIALLVAIFLSPFASKDPDGLERVAQDHQFKNKASQETPAQKLPFHRIFDEYAVRGVPQEIATPVAGLVGTLVTFGLAWGMGKLVIRNPANTSEEDPLTKTR